MHIYLRKERKIDRYIFFFQNALCTYTETTSAKKSNKTANTDEKCDASFFSIHKAIQMDGSEK